ncbi:MAG: tRNA lysidine(34) synthetase TilS [Ignavibacteria bacterium]|nr:tRNA lysidine(34) synthetase TilS [Ignavibacteria bacterium]
MNAVTHTFESAFVEFVTRHELILRGDRILLGVSGGIDSMVLLHLLLTLGERMDIDLQLVHINHRLRGDESDGDEQFVREYAKRLSLPIHVQSVETAMFSSEMGYSIQEGARLLRYRAYEEIRSRIGAHRIATAHHYDDNAETVLMNILRGSGLRGLSGIPVSRDDGTIIRPLLFARRSEIEAYAHDRKIPYRIDSSNASSRYMRNVVRQSIIPMLQRESELDVADTLNKIAEFTGSVRRRVQEETDSVYNQVVAVDSEGNTELNILSFLEYPSYLQEEVLRRILENLTLEPSIDQVEAIRRLCLQSTGRSISLSRSHHVLKDRDSLWFRPVSGRSTYRIDLEVGQTVTTDEFSFSSTVLKEPPGAFGSNPQREYVDGDLLGSHITLRNWLAGDWFTPFGMTSKKKLSDFFVDEKVPLFKKHSTPVLESSTGEIVWVCGMRLDDRFKVTPTTARVVQLDYSPLKQDRP